MNIQIKKIDEVKLNPNNPRIVKDDKFKKLVKSIKDFPKMLEIRPIVVNSDMIVLGGNMRLKACIEAGMSEVPIIVADNLTEEQQKEFLIKDNVSGGQFDWDALANNWDSEVLLEWGLDMPLDFGQQDINEVETFSEEVGFKIDCKNIDELEQLQKLLNVETKRVSFEYLKKFL